MSFVNKIFILTLCSIFVSCAYGGDDQSLSHNVCADNVPYTQDQTSSLYQKLRDFMLKFDTIQNLTGRDSQYSEKEVLRRLHPWFSQKGALCLREDFDTNILLMSKIPLDLIRNLKEIEDQSVNGIGILNSSFWEKVREIQETGLQVGFYRHQKSWEYGGYYRSRGLSNRGKNPLIAFDIFANPGTARHEFRHHQQHQNSNYSFIPNRPVNHSDRCIAAFRSYLGELEATTYQLIDWKGSFSLQSYTDSENSGAFFYPQLVNFTGHLYYPISAKQRVKDAGCGDSLLFVIDKISENIYSFSEVLIPLVNSQKGLAKKYSLLLGSLSSCEETKPCSTREKLKATKKRMRLVSSKIDRLILKEASLRPFYIKGLFEDHLSSSEINFFFNSIGAFKLIYSLEGYQ